jgi:chromosome segregation ATPase
VVADLTTRAESAQAELGAAVQGKDDADAAAGSLRERVGSLEADLEKLTKQVRDLQTESANREVHIAQMEKQRERDREDLQGLNIALDSKQQELELVSLTSVLPVTRSEMDEIITDEAPDECQRYSGHDAGFKQGQSYPTRVKHTLPNEHVASHVPPLRCG